MVFFMNNKYHLSNEVIHAYEDGLITHEEYVALFKNKVVMHLNKYNSMQDLEELIKAQYYLNLLIKEC